MVEAPCGKMLIDTGIGNAKQRPLSPPFNDHDNGFLGRLAAAGVQPDQVGFILLTHLHVDHVGWNTIQSDGVWRQTFPNARYLFSRTEYRFFADPANLSPRHRNSFLARQDSVDPVVANGQAEMIEVDGSEVLPGIRFLPPVTARSTPRS
ncbi:MBL fold metallo-hydrolase [Frigidibacter sp. ROC022]|uniref:MBL fold metallo-hydrolase n=1 Tax=Frigidibacter sp. ROC022 TaxID=2971796 RepID=UPI00215A31CF|nr:MBL fold metallo-hydrolase [Frigidibacter sp. ROC022]MCR8726463.1 MBL fold metallo-hydrolase [Frigidibacter sp. ROC022]